jgi:hypothetical protein
MERGRVTWRDNPAKSRSFDQCARNFSPWLPRAAAWVPRVTCLQLCPFVGTASSNVRFRTIEPVIAFPA